MNVRPCAGVLDNILLPQWRHVLFMAADILPLLVNSASEVARSVKEVAIFQKDKTAF